MCEWFNAFLGIAAFDGLAGIPDGVSDFDRTRGVEGGSWFLKLLALWQVFLFQWNSCL